jgi:hypothetical protein
MPVDAGQPLPAGPRPEWDLPDVLDIRVRRVPYERPRRRHFRSALPDAKEAIEFLVLTSRPIPARAQGPALFIGAEQVVQSSPVGYNQYRFLALRPERLKRGERIGWGWVDDPPKERKRTKYRYEPPSRAKT